MALVLAWVTYDKAMKNIHQVRDNMFAQLSQQEN
jgi:hypothetical protein